MAARLSTDWGHRIGFDTSIPPHAASAIGLPAGIAIDHPAHIAVASGTQRQLQNPSQVMKEIEQVRGRTALAGHELGEGRKLGLGTGEPHTLSEASAKATDPLRLGSLWDDAHAGLRSRAGRLLAVIRCTKGDQPKLDELFSSAVTVCASDPFAAVDSEKHGTEQEKIEAIVDEFDRVRRAQLESAEISRAFGDAMGTTKRAVEFANNRLHDTTAMLTSALLLAIAGLAPAIEGIGRTVTDVVGDRAGILRVDCGADAKTREHGANAGMLHAAQTELTQAESHE